MKKPDEDIIRQVKQWLSYGDEDLKLARHGMAMKEDCPCRLIAYHAQQCVEKHLKAYLVFHTIDFPYTHNISHLLELCSTVSDWPDKLGKAEELTAYAVTTRYPGIDESVSFEDACIAITTAKHVQQIVRQALANEGLT